MKVAPHPVLSVKIWINFIKFNNDKRSSLTVWTMVDNEKTFYDIDARF